MRVNRANLVRMLEWFFALVCAGVCTAVATLFTVQAAGNQRMLPFPGLYLLEIAAAGLLSLAAVAKYDSDPAWRAYPWIAAGILLAFVILGGFSIGPSLIPALLAALAVSVLSGYRLSALTGKNVLLFFAAAFLQAALVMLFAFGANF